MKSASRQQLTGCLLFSEKINKTTKIEKRTMEIEEKGVRLRLTVVDTPGELRNQSAPLTTQTAAETNFYISGNVVTECFTAAENQVRFKAPSTNSLLCRYDCTIY